MIDQETVQKGFAQGDIRRIQKADMSSLTHLQGGGTGGRLSPGQATKFMTDSVVSQSSFLKDVEEIRMTEDRYNLDDLTIASRVTRKGTENTAGTRTAATTTQRNMTAIETVLSYGVSYQFVEDNIERGGVKNTLQSLFGIIMANDSEDLAINGDEADAGADAAFLTINDGWLKIITGEAGVHTYVLAGSDYIGTIFPGMIAQLPLKWKNSPSRPALLITQTAYEGYLAQLQALGTRLADDVLAGGSFPVFWGYQVRPLRYLSAGMLFTPPKNLVWGWHARNMSLEVDRDIEARTHIVVLTSRADFEIKQPDAIVYGT